MGTSKVDFFRVLYNSKESGTKARYGVITTSHSEIETPVFMPVGTAGAIKAVENREMEEFDTRIILANTYHLYLRPGIEVLKLAGGLHKFMNWKRSILTDSGGFQVFSLSGLKKVRDEGVEFASHIDGSRHLLTPEKAIDVQRIIGSDIMMSLDECLPNPSDKKTVEKSIRRTFDWEKRCLQQFKATEDKYGFPQYLYAITQGGIFKDLRRKSIEELSELDFDGNAIGGLAVGEPAEVMYELVDFSTELLPAIKPIYLMGVGTPIDLLECVDRGVDMFDCVLPTRNARHGRIFTSRGEINIRNSRFTSDFRLIDDEYSTYVSENFSFAYIRHLFIAKEILGMQLASIHNLGFYMKLMEKIREAIRENRFKKFKDDFIEKYKTKDLKS